jgi:hypothetical protein
LPPIASPILSSRCHHLIGSRILGRRFHWLLAGPSGRMARAKWSRADPSKGSARVPRRRATHRARRIGSIGSGGASPPPSCKPS